VSKINQNLPFFFMPFLAERGRSLAEPEVRIRFEVNRPHGVAWLCLA
jgi:hypothetical protein